MINWNTTKEDTELITKIAQRAVAMEDSNYEYMDASMDVTAVHLNDCKLRLKDLLEADDFNFIHDVFGIRKYIDRETGKLTDCFLPRFVIREESPEEPKAPFVMGAPVVRVSSDYTNGRTGTIIDMDLQKGRARVNWEGHPNTWVKFSSLNKYTG